MNYIPSVTIPGKDENKVYDLFSMLLSERIIFINGEIDSSLASVVVSEIIYLSATSKKEKITIYINSPGGEVNAGLAIYDAMKASPCPIETIGSGLCASMGALLLSSGDKGLRKAYPNNFGNCNSVNVKNLGTSGLIQKYTTTDFTVFFNADSKSYSIDSTEQVSGKIVTISNGIVEIAESETLVSSIPMLSTVIIKNK